ncbi:malto-oligosyltrehalose trehalohydrolase [bacterium BMS3Abin03]|nr:malto-oligosyltrehalose trehalohydrolase [bacterium BMS3Abin03]
MKHILTFFITLLITNVVYSQVVVTVPEFPTENDSITVFLDTTQPGAEELLNYTGTVYAHTGVNTNFGDWQHVIGDWGNNQNQPALTRLGSNLYKLVIGFPREFYSVTNSSEQIYQLVFVFRSADGTKQTRPDIFINIYEPGLNLIVESPEVSVSFGDPQRSPAFVKEGSSVEVIIKAVEIETLTSSLTLFVDNNQVAQTNTDSLNYLFNYSDYPSGPHDVVAVGVDTAGSTDSTDFIMFVNPTMVNQIPPQGIEAGITINSPSSVTFELLAPYKDFVYLIGDFSDWKVESQYFLNRYAFSADSVVWWITLNNVSVGTEIAFQYLVDGKIRIGDPFAHKILDPWNDQWIDPGTYPNLKPYPQDKTDYPVTTFQTAEAPYPWQITSFNKPPIEKLVIYELLMRDFLESHDYKTLRDTLQYLKNLGINAIELMPIMEFSGNISWGYNPIYHLAPDKYYGPADDLKSFIDSAHANGIAVILDVVLNQIDNLSPLAMLYWDDVNNRPAANNPWLNQTAPHPYSVFNDFNHESTDTKYYVDRVLKFWIEEFKVDGFRFDLSKGFTQTYSGNDVNLWSQYDQSRIDIIERMMNKMWEFDSTAYAILEHFAVNSEETVLSDDGMLLWNNMNYEYNEATMGYNSNITGTSYLTRGWTVPHLVSYMESHDEERLMYKNLQYGNSNGNYNIKNFPIAIQRIKLAAAFYFTIPGIKMMWQFGELGYDFSINYPCGNDGCRTDPKPIKWDYFNDGNRRNLYKVFQALINLKKDYPAFNSSNHTMKLNTFAKRLTILDPTMNVNVIGNFAVVANNINPEFPDTGWWYDFFSGDSIFVNNVTDVIPLLPGEFHIYTTVKLPAPEEGILSGIEGASGETVTDYRLEQNYPNPFNPSTTIKFDVADFGLVNLKVYDVLGNEVATLINKELPAGNYRVTFDASQLASGVYIYRLRAGGFIVSKKMILLK